MGIELEAYLRKRREALLMELRHIEQQLGIEQRVVAICPSCKQKYNKKTA